MILISLVAAAATRPLLRFDYRQYRDAVRYGFPLLLTVFLYALADMTDRWFLAEFDGVVAVGFYAMHLKLAAILAQAIVIPFGLWFPPERFKRMKEYDEGRLFFIRTAVALSLTSGYLAGCVWLARDFILPLIAPGILALPFVLACCLGSVICLALSQALNVGLLLPGHTGKNAVCNMYAIVVTVLACGILVPSFGTSGAAISRLFGGVVLVVATAVSSYRVFPIAFPIIELSLYFVASATAIFTADLVLAGHGFPKMLLSLIMWSAITLLFASLLWSKFLSAGPETSKGPSAR